jgi:hypothetical protein
MKQAFFLIAGLFLTSTFANAQNSLIRPTQVDSYKRAVTDALVGKQVNCVNSDNEAMSIDEDGALDGIAKDIRAADSIYEDLSGAQPLLTFSLSLDKVFPGSDENISRKGQTVLQVTTSTDEKQLVLVVILDRYSLTDTINKNFGSIGHPNFQDQTTTTNYSSKVVCTVK